MTQQHSPEPWSIHYDLGDIIDSGGHYITRTSERLDTERIVVCINACRGISNEELEAGVVSQKVHDVTLTNLSYLQVKCTSEKG